MEEFKNKPKVYERIKEAMDGRTNKWLIDKLAGKGIRLDSSQVSQRLSGDINFSGDEAIACFEILNIPVLEKENAEN